MAYVPPGARACCVRCEGGLRAGSRHWLSNSRTAAIATAALLLFPLAVTLPIIRIEKFGHEHEAGIIEGVTALLSRGHLIVGVIVLACSVILPVLPLIGAPLSFLVGIGSLILWILLMVKAYQGELFKLPVAGDWAEDQSGKPA